MKTTIVTFYAYNRLAIEVFQKGESNLQIHETLSAMCSSYEAVDIKYGILESLPLSTLTSLHAPSVKIKPNEKESRILIESLQDYKQKAIQFKENIAIGHAECNELAISLDEKYNIAHELQKRILNGKEN